MVIIDIHVIAINERARFFYALVQLILLSFYSFFIDTMKRGIIAENMCDDRGHYINKKLTLYLKN